MKTSGGWRGSPFYLPGFFPSLQITLYLEWPSFGRNLEWGKESSVTLEVPAVPPLPAKEPVIAPTYWPTPSRPNLVIWIYLLTIDLSGLQQGEEAGPQDSMMTPKSPQRSCSKCIPRLAPVWTTLQGSGLPPDFPLLYTQLRCYLLQEASPDPPDLKGVPQEYSSTTQAGPCWTQPS